MCNPKTFARESVEEIARDGFTRREADGMHQPVQLGPGFAQIRKERRNLLVAAHIAFEYQITAKFLGVISDALLEAFANVGESQLGAFALARLRNAIGNRAIGQHPSDQYFFALQKCHSRLPEAGCRPAKGAIVGAWDGAAQIARALAQRGHARSSLKTAILDAFFLCKPSHHDPSACQSRFPSRCQHPGGCRPVVRCQCLGGACVLLVRHTQISSGLQSFRLPESGRAQRR
jgi:hypothetical protein